MLKQSAFKFLIGVFLICPLQSDPGDIIDYNLQGTLSVDDINWLLLLMGTDAEVQYPISIYDIEYETEGEGGYGDTLAGLVVFPHSTMKAFPLLIYHHGTIVLDNEAPSITGLSMDNPEITLISLITSPAGFITLFPDYEGLGDPDKFHPYIVANSYAHADVNMVRAVKQLSYEFESAESVQFNDQLFLFGYSEGGYATLAAQRGFQLYHSDEFTVTASCPMAGPYDLADTMVDYFLSIPSYPRPYYVPYVLTSHLWYYQGLEVDFGEFFEPFWADTLPSLFDGTHSGSEIDALMPDNPLDILIPEVLEDFTTNEDHFFRQSLEENTLLDWVPESPTHFFHGLGDDIIPYENAQVAYDTFEANGATDISITLFSEELGGHSEVAPTCLFAGYEVILSYQAISPKGDLNSDGLISITDLELLLESILIENDLTEFQWWAGDVDSDYTHSVFDLLRLSDMVDD